MNIKTPFHVTKSMEIDQEACIKNIRSGLDNNFMSLRELATLMELSAAFLSDLQAGNRKWTERRYEQAMRIFSKRSK